jgi:hypothetical protein
MRMAILASCSSADCCHREDCDLPTPISDSLGGDAVDLRPRRSLIGARFARSFRLLHLARQHRRGSRRAARFGHFPLVL